MLLIAKDIDGTLIGVSPDGNVSSFDVADNQIFENYKITLSTYIENIRDNLLLQKLHYEGEDLGLVSSDWKILFS